MSSGQNKNKVSNLSPATQNLLELPVNPGTGTQLGNKRTNKSLTTSPPGNTQPLEVNCSASNNLLSTLECKNSTMGDKVPAWFLHWDKKKFDPHVALLASILKRMESIKTLHNHRVWQS